MPHSCDRAFKILSHEWRIAYLKSLSHECRISLRMRNGWPLTYQKRKTLTKEKNNVQTTHVYGHRWTSIQRIKRTWIAFQMISTDDILFLICRLMRHSTCGRAFRPCHTSATCISLRTYDERMPFLTSVECLSKMRFIPVWSVDWTLIIR